MEISPQFREVVPTNRGEVAPTGRVCNCYGIPLNIPEATVRNMQEADSFLSIYGSAGQRDFGALSEMDDHTANRMMHAVVHRAYEMSDEGHKNGHSNLELEAP